MWVNRIWLTIVFHFKSYFCLCKRLGDFFFYFQRWKMICLIFSAENKDGTKFRKLAEWFIYGTAWEFGDTSFSKSELIGYSTTLFMPTNNIKVPLGFQRHSEVPNLFIYPIYLLTWYLILRWIWGTHTSISLKIRNINNSS